MQPYFDPTRKTTSEKKMEDDLKKNEKMEDDLKKKGRWPKKEMEDDQKKGKKRGKKTT